MDILGNDNLRLRVPIHWTMKEKLWYSAMQSTIRIKTDKQYGLITQKVVRGVLRHFEDGMVAKLNRNENEISITSGKILHGYRTVKLTDNLYNKCISRWNHLFVFKHGNALCLCPLAMHLNYCSFGCIELASEIPLLTYDATENIFIEGGKKRNKNATFIPRSITKNDNAPKRCKAKKPRDVTRQEKYPISLTSRKTRYTLIYQKTLDDEKRKEDDGKRGKDDVERKNDDGERRNDDGERKKVFGEMSNNFKRMFLYQFQEDLLLPLTGDVERYPAFRSFPADEDVHYSVQTSDEQEGHRYIYTTESMVPERDDISFHPSVPSRYEEYATLQRRIGSFSTWPHPTALQDCKQMAETGLFFTGPHDLVRCYHCGIGLKDWSQEDNPLYEHIRYSPQCEFLANTVEPSLLRQYQFYLPNPNEGTQDGASSRNEPPGTIYRHPEYQAYEVRVSSFAKWPRDIIQTPAQLADAGFFYTGMQDVVRCFACDGGLQRWDPEDDPWIEHARWFPECAHVIQVKGVEYIHLVRLAMDNQDSGNDDDEGGIAQGLNHLQINNGTQQPRKESDDPIYRPAAQSVIGFGYSRAAVKMAIEECNSKHICWKAEDLLNLLLDKEDRGEVLPIDSPRTEESPVMPLQIDTTTEEGLLEERSMLLSRLKCIRCGENDVNVLFLPCAHHRMCVNCVADVTMCPICGKTVKEKIKTYMA